MLLQIPVSIAATIAFSVLFGVPRRYYPYCGIIGCIGWMLYTILLDSLGVSMASFAAAAAVIFLSRLTAIWQHCPVTIFLISGIFPLVPGAGVYWTAYYFVNDDLQLAVQNGTSAVKVAFAIVLAIVIIFEIPQGFFQLLLGRKR